MIKNKNIENNQKTRERIMELILGTGISIQAFFSPARAIPFTFVLNLLCYAANDFCDWYKAGKRKKDYLDNYEELLLETDVLNDLEEVDKRIYVDMASEVFLSLKDTDLETYSLDMVDRIVTEKVKGRYKNTVDREQDIVSNIVTYSLTKIQFVINEKDFISYITQENYRRKKEIDNLKHEMGDIDSRISALEQTEVCVKTKNQQEEYINAIIEEYAKHFTESLYLHKGDENVNLQNLFVIPNVSNIGSGRETSKLSDYLSSTFLNQDKPLILLGDAGSGKTTIVSWLAYLYSEQKNSYISKIIFCDKQLLIIRLRDVDKSYIRDEGLFEAICKYLHMDHKSKVFSDKYVILDGMDEISLSENCVNYKRRFNEIYEKSLDSFKLIITSRSSVVSNDTVSDKHGRGIYNVYKINPFSYTNKCEWIDNYERCTNEKIASEIKNHILSTDNTIFDYPQLMYMIAGDKPNGEIWSLDNEWSIYHHVFSDVVFSRDYDIKTHPFERYHDTVYRVLEMIGYEMHLDNSGTKVAKKRIKDLLNELDDSHLKDSNELIDAFEKYGYGLGCYWKIGDEAEVEFYHNNIRDYFIAEYLFRRLNTIFSSVVETNELSRCCEESHDKKENGLFKLASELYDLLRWIPLSWKVVNFLSQRASFLANENCLDSEDVFTIFLKNNVPMLDITKVPDYSSYFNCPFSKFMMELCYDTNIYHEFSKDGEISVAEKVSTFLNNVLTLIHAILSDYEVDKYISPFGYDNTLRNEYLISAYKYSQDDRYINLSRGYFPYGNFTNADLTDADINGAYLEHAFMEHSKMHRVDMDNSILRSAILFGADFYDSMLTHVDFSKAYLDRTILDDSDLTGSLFEGTILKDIHCTGAYAILDDEERTLNSESDLISEFGKSKFVFPTEADLNHSIRHKRIKL